MSDKDLKEIKALLEKNIELNKRILGRTEKINKYVKFRKIWGVIKVVFIVVPLVLSFIYLPPLLKPVIDEYMKLFNSLKNPSSGYQQDAEELTGKEDVSNLERGENSTNTTLKQDF